jgi:hypothetical protein
MRLSTFLVMVLAVAGMAAGCREQAAGKPEKLAQSGELKKAETGKAQRRFLDNLPWSEASENGLQTRLTAAARQFNSGDQIPVRLELRHKDGRMFAQIRHEQRSRQERARHAAVGHGLVAAQGSQPA